MNEITRIYICKWKKWTALSGFLLFIMLMVPMPVLAANIYETKPENYIAWDNMPTVWLSEDKRYFQITDMRSYGSNLTNDMSLGDGYYNSMHYYSDTRIIYQKRFGTTLGTKINLTGAQKDVDKGGLITSAMGRISWNVMEWDACGGFLWDSGWIATDETYTVGLDSRGKCSSWGVDYSVGSRDSVAYITILFRFVDESGYDGAGTVAITPENVAEYFPNLFLCYQPFTYTIDYGGYGNNITVNRLGAEKTTLVLPEVSNRPGYDVEWKVMSKSVLAENWMDGKQYTTAVVNKWLSDGNFYNSLFGDVTFYAVYIPKEFKVTYDANGGTTSVVTKTYRYGDAVDLSITAKQSGYVFVGWSTMRNARLPLTDFTMSEGDVTLYAIYSMEVSDVQNHKYPSYTPTETVKDDEVYLRIWIKEDSTLCNYYPLTYVGDVGDMTYRYKLPLVDLSDFTKGRAYCYQLIVWDNAGNRKILYEDSSDGSKIVEPEEAKTYIQVVEHYKYDACNGVWKWFAQTTSQVEEGNKFVPAYMKPPEGYRTERIDAGGVVYANHTYQAYYMPQKYCVNFDANGGTCDETSKEVLYEGYYGQLPIPSQEGHTFFGWNTKEDGSGENITSGDVYAIASDSTLYAQYKVNTYTIMYHANGGNGSMQNTSISYGREWELTPNRYVLEGYTFAGWAESPTGEVRYADKALVHNLCVEDGDVIHLYAMYEKQITVTLVEMSDLGSIRTQHVDKVYHTKPYTTIRISERENWTGGTNVGWSDTTSATGAVITSTGTTFTAREDVTLYAIYVSEICLDYNTNGSAVQYDGLTKKCYYNASGKVDYPCFSVLSGPALSNHSFISWRVTKGSVRDSMGKKLDFCQPGQDVIIEENTVLTAVWDAFPELEVYNRYFTLEEAQAGAITQEALLEKVYGRDKEDGSLKNGEDVWVKNYDASMFEKMTSDQEVRITYQASDCAGNTVMKSVLVYIIDTATRKMPQIRYVRFIHPNFYWDDTGELRSYEEGGLEQNSIWRTQPTYSTLLQHALTDAKEENETWIFTKSDLDKMKTYTKDYGYVLEALDAFWELFSQCKKQ